MVKITDSKLIKSHFELLEMNVGENDSTIDFIGENLEQIDNLYIVSSEEMNWEADGISFEFNGLCSNSEETSVVIYADKYYIFSDAYVL